MNYTECQKIVDSTKHIFEGTGYAVDYYLDAEPFFTLDGEMIEANELPDTIKAAFDTILETLKIEF